MSPADYSDDFLREVFAQTKVIALVGASHKPERPSFGVMRFLLSKGFEVIPVNPGLAGQELHGQKVYASLRDIGRPFDMVDVFRESAALPGIVDEIVTYCNLPKFLWTQLGVIEHDAAKRAEEAGIRVIMNRCPAIEMPRLGL